MRQGGAVEGLKPQKAPAQGPGLQGSTWGSNIEGPSGKCSGCRSLSRLTLRAAAAFRGRDAHKSPGNRAGAEVPNEDNHKEGPEWTCRPLFPTRRPAAAFRRPRRIFPRAPYPTLALPASDRAVSWCALRHTSASKSGHRLGHGMATRINPNTSAAVGAPQAPASGAARRPARAGTGL